MVQEQVSNISGWNEFLKTFIPIASLVLNIILGFYFFNSKSKTDAAETERKIKLDWFKILILDNNLKYFHQFFDDIEARLYPFCRTENS